jgi:hypothetical protein
VAVELVFLDVADRAKIVYRASRHHLAKAGIQLEELKTSRRPGRITPYRLLQSIGAKHRIGVEVRTDEAGELFLWCTTAVDQKAWRQRFSQTTRRRAGE